MDADADCAGIVLEAGARTGHGVRLSRDGPEAFGFLNREFDRIDSLVVDVDPGSMEWPSSRLCARFGTVRRSLSLRPALEESHMETGGGATWRGGLPGQAVVNRATAERVIDRFVRPENGSGNFMRSVGASVRP